MQRHLAGDLGSAYHCLTGAVAEITTWLGRICLVSAEPRTPCPRNAASGRCSGGAPLLALRSQACFRRSEAPASLQTEALALLTHQCQRRVRRPEEPRILRLDRYDVLCQMSKLSSEASPATRKHDCFSKRPSMSYGMSAVVAMLDSKMFSVSGHESALLVASP